MAHVSVMLIVPDADRAVAWYTEALGATELWNLGGVAGLQIAGAPFFVHAINPANPSESSPAEVGQTSTRVELFVDHPEEVARALAAALRPARRSWPTRRRGARIGRVGFATRSAISGRSATSRLCAGSRPSNRIATCGPPCSTTVRLNCRRMDDQTGTLQDSEPPRSSGRTAARPGVPSLACR